MNAVAKTQPVEQLPVVPASEAASLMEVITRAARDPDTDVDKLERMMGMYERITSQQAEQAFNSAMMAAQSEMGPISADATNTQTKSKYATYGKLDQAIRPIYTKHGFAISFDTGDGAPPDHVRILAYATHNSGFTRTYKADMPNDGKGAKGNDVMTKTHATGAAMQYGMRYLLKMIFNVAVGEMDRDGNAPVDPPKVVTEEQVKELLSLIEEAGTDADTFCRVGKIESVPDLPAAGFDKAKAWLADRIRRRQQKAAVDPQEQFDRMEAGQ